MAQSSPSQLLEALLKALSKAQKANPNNALPLDSTTLTGTPGANLLNLFSQQLNITSFTLATDVQLPTSVTGDTLTISGDNGSITLTVNFQDLSGEIAIEALFQAAATTTLTAQFPSLPSTFFQLINTSQASPTIDVPGLASTLSFDSTLFGVVGYVVPRSGLVAYSIAPQIQGQVTLTSKGLAVVVQTNTSGWQLSPLDGSGWTFTDVGSLLPNLSILDAFPSIISTQNLGLNDFGLTLFDTAPSLSSVTLDVANTQDPTQPLWTAAGGKIQLLDVVVTLGLNYDQPSTISLTGTGWIQGNFQLGSLELQAQIPFPLNQGVWSITAYPNLQLPDLGDIATLLSDSSSMNDLMPAGIAGIGGFTFTYLRVAVNASGSNFSLNEFTFGLTSTNPWPLIPDNVLTLDQLQIQMTIDSTPSILGFVNGHFVMGTDSDVFVSFGRISASLPWGINVISPAIALPNIGQIGSLVQGADLSSQIQAAGLNQLHLLITNLNLGLTISPTKLTNLGMTLSLANASQPTIPSLDWEVIPGTLTLTNFSVGFQLNWNPTLAIDVSGLFTVNGLNFDLKFGENTNGDAFIAAYSPATADAGTVDVKQLINQIAPTIASALPDNLDVDLADAVVAYVNTNNTQKFLFAMDISVEFPLSDIPLIGKEFSSGAEAGIQNLKIVVTSAGLLATDVALINQLIGELPGVKPLPAPPANQSVVVIPSGFSMVAELVLGDQTILITSPAPPSSTQTSTGAAATPSTALITNDGGTASTNSVMWINVQKTFGPVTIQKVGFSYQNGAIFILTNMSLAAGGLEIDLLGLGIGSPITNPSVEFTIQGIAVSFQEGPVSIQGGMLGTISPVNFVGALSVQMTEFTLAAFAGYAELDSQPSFFLYGVLNAPLGGIPAFFVTGIAAGFGFNRQLIIPDVSQVNNFPLVQWAIGTNNPPSMNPSQPIGDQVNAVLTRLANSGVVSPSIGEYWFAAGLSFTSFELVSSFALLILEVGTQVEIALLGISTCQIPPDEPVAEVQIALEVTFSPATGLLAIAGQLTNNSYILSRDCRLTGGFAFYIWFGSEHSGETVLTFGGYNPNFTVPDYYPQVPRLGMNWQVTSELNIQGSLYFALTSSAVMAGGMMSAVWQSGSIRAWYTVWADFLMVFSPFHYYIEGGIDLGASFSIKLLFFRVTMTIHLGVDIKIWGPDFSGVATIDLSIISFTISFGASSQNTSTQIPWSDFVNQLLPSQSQPNNQLVVNASAANAGGTSSAPAPVQIVITQGLIQTLANTTSNPQYLVNGETFLCSVLTLIPIKATTFTGNVALSPQQPTDGQGAEIQPNTNFGAGPAGIQPADFQPALTLNVATAAESNFNAVRRFNNSPQALWQNKSFDSNGVPQTDPSTALSDTTLPNTLQGYDLVPVVAPPDHTLPIPLETLLFTLDDNIQPFTWSTPTISTSDPFTTQTVASTINTPTVTGVRNQLLAAIQQQGISLDPQINVASLADPANNDLLAPPALRLLGEEKAST